MLDAKRSEEDPIRQPFRVKAVDQAQKHLETMAGMKYLHRTDAMDEWSRVVRALKPKDSKSEKDIIEVGTWRYL